MKTKYVIEVSVHTEEEVTKKAMREAVDQALMAIDLWSNKRMFRVRVTRAKVRSIDKE